MKEKFKIQTRYTRFPGFDGGQLAATLDFPAEILPKKYIIVSHCFTCNRQLLVTARLCRGLAKAGYAVLRFDFTGLGESEGEFADTHFRSMIADVECAARWLATHYEPASVLIGHSMGGTVSLAASQNSESALSAVENIVTLASPSYPAHVLHHFGDAMPALLRGENAEIIVAGQAYPVKPAFVKDVQSYDMGKQMQACQLPIMAIYAGNDDLVEPQAAEEIVKYTHAKSALRLIEEADHLFSERKHAEQLLLNILEWIE